MHLMCNYMPIIGPAQRKKKSRRHSAARFACGVTRCRERLFCAGGGSASMGPVRVAQLGHQTRGDSSTACASAMRTRTVIGPRSIHVTAAHLHRTPSLLAAAAAAAFVGRDDERQSTDVLHGLISAPAVPSAELAGQAPFSELGFPRCTAWRMKCIILRAPPRAQPYFFLRRYTSGRRRTGTGPHLTSEKGIS